MHPYSLTPWAEAKIRAAFHGYTQTATTQRPSDRIETITAADGSWHMDLWPNAEGDYDSHYQFRFPNDDRIHRVTLPSGLPSEIEFSQLYLNATPPESPIYPSLIALIDSRLAGSNFSLPSGGTIGQNLAITQETPRILGWRDPSYVHQQAIADVEWIVNHNLGNKPDHEVYLDSGVSVLADTIHVSANQLRVYWATPRTGFVYCS